MIRALFDSLPLWMTLPALGGLGFLSGLVYFRMIGIGVRFTIVDSRPSLAILAWFGRLTIMGGVLVFASFCGAVALMITTVGVLAGRFAVLRFEREKGSWSHR